MCPVDGERKFVGLCDKGPHGSRSAASVLRTYAQWERDKPVIGHPSRTGGNEIATAAARLSGFGPFSAVHACERKASPRVVDRDDILRAEPTLQDLLRQRILDR